MTDSCKKGEKPREFWIYGKKDFWKVTDTECIANEYPDHEVRHTLCVEIPDRAITALHEDALNQDDESAK